MAEDPISNLSLSDSDHECDPPELKTVEDKPTAGYKVDDKPTAGCKVDDKPTEGYKVDEKPTEGYKVDDKPTAGYKVDEKPTAGYDVDDNCGFSDDWQSGKDFIQTNLMMLESESLTDATFRVGEEEEVIRAHRFMLASRSCVFFAMFCGQMAENGEIKITDIHPNNFRDFLRYLYTGVIALTADNAINLLYCSKKYCVKALEQEILEYCKSSITADNACVLLEQACLFGEKDLQEAAFNVMKRDASLVLMSESITGISHDNLDKLLDMDDLIVDEAIVFKAAMSWAKAECERQGKKPVTSEMRAVLGDTLFKIRFPLMPQDHFVSLVGSEGILTDGERVKILERYISPKSPTQPFVSKPRRKPSQVYKIQRLVHGGIGYPLSRATDALHISCDKSVIFLGVMLYAPANVTPGAISFLRSLLDSQSVVEESLTFYITIVVRDPNNTRIGIHHEDRKVKSADDQIEIPMSSPVRMSAGEKYTISVLIEGSSRCWGTMNALTRLTDPGAEATWSFAHAPTKSSFDDSLKEGHISGIIYSLDSDA